MKKKIGYLLLSLFIIPCLFLFSGCGETDPPVLTPLTDKMVSLDYSTTVYTGLEKKPAVTVRIDGQSVSETEYTVTYLNNVNVGTARVVVAASEGSTTLSGSVTKTFAITRVSKTVSNYSELKNTLSDTNYISIYTNGNIVVPAGETLTIRSDVNLNLGVFNLDNNGTIINNGTLVLNSKPTGTGTLTNNGIINANVNTRQGFVDAIGYASKVILSSTITGGTNVLEEVVVNGEENVKDITIDLNGKNLETGIKVVGSNTNKVSVRITNSSSTPSTIGTENHDYGLTISGTGNSNFNVQLNNLNFIGFKGGIATTTNSANGVIAATNCTFEGKNFGDADLSTTCVGANLSASYGYTFKNCTFVGYTAYYTNSGTHGLTNCTFEAKGTTYHEPDLTNNFYNPTGSAIVVDSANNYTKQFTVYVTGATIKSECGYGLEEFASVATSQEKQYYADITVAGKTTFKVSKQNYVSSNDVITDEIVIEQD